MSLYRRQQNQPKPIRIGDLDFYTLKDAAKVLDISKSKLTKGLGTKYPFKHSRFDDFENAKIYVLASDVHVYKRQREKQFLQRLQYAG